MKFLRAWVFLFVLGLFGCTSLKFNNDYVGQNWTSVAVAPFFGDEKVNAERAFMHEFGTDSNVKFIDPNFVLAKIKESGKLEMFYDSPMQVMAYISKELKVDAFIIGDIKLVKTKYLDSSSNYAQVSMSLYDSMDLSLVGSSIQDSDSVFYGPESVLNSALSSSFDDLKEFFKLINS